MSTITEDFDPNCRPLLTFQESLQKFFSSKLGNQAYQMAASLPPMATSRFYRIPKTYRTILVTGAIGVAVYSFMSWFTRRPSKKSKQNKFAGYPRKRNRKSSTRSMNVGSEAGSSIYKNYNWIELQRQSVSDQDSVVSNTTLVDGTQLAPQQLGLMGMEALETVIAYWEDALAAYNPTARSLVLTTREESEFRQSLEEILDMAYQLQELSETLFIHQNSVLNKHEIFLKHKQEVLADSERSHRSSLKRNCALSVSTLEDLSFVSAEETIADLKDFDDFDIDIDKLELYQAALKIEKTNGVPYRAIRTEFLGCPSDSDYLAKLYCLRLAFKEIMNSESNRQWWIENGRAILAQLMVRSNKHPDEITLAYDELIDYLGNDGVLKKMEEELKSRNVKCINFYDVCLDYILIDSFEDLESPPSSVLAVMKNRWLSNTFKESALQTAIWSVFQAKRRLLKDHKGFKSRFYTVSEILTPTLAWAFFGTNESLLTLVNDFKREVVAFLADIYSFSRVDYTSIDSLSRTVMDVAQTRLESVRAKLENFKT